MAFSTAYTADNWRSTARPGSISPPATPPRWQNQQQPTRRTKSDGDKPNTALFSTNWRSKSAPLTLASPVPAAGEVWYLKDFAVSSSADLRLGGSNPLPPGIHGHPVLILSTDAAASTATFVLMSSLNNTNLVQHQANPDGYYASRAHEYLPVSTHLGTPPHPNAADRPVRLRGPNLPAGAYKPTYIKHSEVWTGRLSDLDAWYSKDARAPARHFDDGDMAVIRRLAVPEATGLLTPPASPTRSAAAPSSPWSSPLAVPKRKRSPGNGSSNNPFGMPMPDSPLRSTKRARNDMPEALKTAV